MTADSAELSAILGILGVGAGLGFSVAGNYVDNTITAEIDDTTVNDAATVEVENCIAWGNAQNGMFTSSQWDTVSVRHSISQEAWHGRGNL